VYQVGNNKKVILWCTANEISRYKFSLPQIYLYNAYDANISNITSE